MPIYELSLLVKPLKKEQVAACLKRAAGLIWSANGTISSVQFFGLVDLPHKIHHDNHSFYKANRFVYKLSLGSEKLRDVKPELRLDPDLLKSQFISNTIARLPSNYECTLQEELLPPALRKSVQPLLKGTNVRDSSRR